MPLACPNRYFLLLHVDSIHVECIGGLKLTLNGLGQIVMIDEASDRLDLLAVA
jgi:hypothetical protein